MESPVRSPSRRGHGRAKSASVLKSIVKPSSRSASPKKRAAFAGDAQNALKDRMQMFSDKPLKESSPSKSRVLHSIENNTPKSPKRTNRTPQKTLSLDLWQDHGDTVLSPAESALLTPGRNDYFTPKGKENATPPVSASPRPANVEMYTPIWAQFSTQPEQELAKMRESSFNASAEEKTLPPTPSAKDTPLPQASMPRTARHARQDSAPSAISTSPQKKSKVLAAVAKLQGIGSGAAKDNDETLLDGAMLDKAFEDVLVSRNIPEHRRQNMRGLDAKIKREFIRNHKPDQSDDADKGGKGFLSQLKFSKGDKSARGRTDARAMPSEENATDSPSKRSHSRNGTFSWSKRARSNSRPRSIMSLKNLSSTSVNTLASQSSKRDSQEISAVSAFSAFPDEFVTYLKAQDKPEKVEIGKIKKLRLLLRNEAVEWVDAFIELGGMSALDVLLRKVMKVEWREEHEDLLLHEVLLCLKGLCTTQRALEQLNAMSPTLFPELLDMLFDEERRGPAEFTTRGVVTTLLFAHLAAASPANRKQRAQSILSYLSDRQPDEPQRPAGFILQMQQKRPYQAWCKEVSSVAKEVFWIFLHHLNTIETQPADETSSQDSYFARHFPKERPPVPAAPYIGGVEWEATNYLASHLDLMNGLIASLPARPDRNALREDLRASGFERVMGEKLRLCKEKFYGAVHDGLRTWSAAAIEDGWDAQDVRVGPPRGADSPKKDGSPKKAVPPAPQLELPKLDAGRDAGGDFWL